MKNEAAFIAAQAGVVPLLTGIPGVAKTATTNAFAVAMKRPSYTLIGSIREPADIAGYPMLKNGNQPACMEFVPPSWVHRLNEQPSVLFVDELTCCAPTVQAALLRVIAEKVVGDVQLRPDTIVMAACNPPDQAAGGYDLEPPMANRLCHLTWEIDWESWDSGMLNGLTFPEPKVPVLPVDWRRHLGDWAARVAAFRRHRPTLFADMPKERSQQSGPWPSPRSWTNGALCLAAAASVGAKGETRHELLAGCVGSGPAGEFFAWMDSMDLPDPSELIEAAAKDIKAGREVEWKPLGRPDKVLACLAAVRHAVGEKPKLDVWRAAMEICTAALDESAEIACSIAARLHGKETRPKGGMVPKKLEKYICEHIVDHVGTAIVPKGSV